MEQNQTQETQETPKITEQQLFDKLKPLYQHQLSIDEDIAALKAEGKEAGLQVTAIATLAKAAAADKLDSVQEKAATTLELISQLT